MTEQIKNQGGFLMGMVSVFFVIFTITGMTLLTLSYQSSRSTSNIIHKLKNKYDVESMVNLAIWEVNTGTNLRVVYGVPEVEATYVDSSNKLVVSTERYGIPYELTVELEDNLGPYYNIWPKRVKLGSWN